LYYALLSKYDFERVRSAVEEVLKTHKYSSLPTPAELLKFVEETKEEKAMKAWCLLLDAAKNHGYYSSVEFEDKTIHAVIEQMGGWMWFCSQDVGQLPFIEKQFYKLYELLSKNKYHAANRLIGYHESINSAKGHKNAIPETVRVGFDKLMIGRAV
jgi:hypothetical protein